jgi:hypothetical protein
MMNANVASGNASGQRRRERLFSTNDAEPQQEQFIFG